jgi:hypothetical protein
MDPVELEACRLNSYFHVNQFKKVVLRNLGRDVGEIRIHTWLPTDGKDIDLPNHPWNFCSFVLDGSLINTFHEEREGIEYRRTAIGPIGQGRDGYTYIDDGLCSLSLKGGATITAGGGYYLDHSLIHNAFSVNGATTLMIQSEFVREVTFAYRNSKNARTAISRFTEKEIIDTLNRVSNLIEGF